MLSIIPKSGLKMAFVDFAELCAKNRRKEKRKNKHCYAAFSGFAEAVITLNPSSTRDQFCN
jgi:hypothetical protein